MVTYPLPGYIVLKIHRTDVNYVILKLISKLDKGMLTNNKIKEHYHKKVHLFQRTLTNPPLVVLMLAFLSGACVFQF